MRNMKVQQKPELEATQPQITQELAAMCRENCCDGFEFYDNQVLDEQVDTIADCRWSIPGI
jgi:hypothetical protein